MNRGGGSGVPGSQSFSSVAATIKRTACVDPQPVGWIMFLCCRTLWAPLQTAEERYFKTGNTNTTPQSAQIHGGIHGAVRGPEITAAVQVYFKSGGLTLWMCSRQRFEKGRTPSIKSTGLEVTAAVCASDTYLPRQDSTLLSFKLTWRTVRTN